MILEVFEEVLENLDTEGEDTFGDDWMDLVGERLSALEAAYRTLTASGRDPIDYSELSTQTAYVFAYGMPRAGFTYERLNQHRESLGRPLFAREHIRVASVGGGPASELIGLLKYLVERHADELVTSIEYTIYDNGGEWESVASLAAECASEDITVDLQFRTLDLLDSKAVQSATLADNELVIFSYVISELISYKNDKPVEDNIRTLLRSLDRDSFVLYLDSES